MKNKILKFSISTYIIFCLLFFVKYLRPILGELSDIFMMSIYLWPYPLALSLQKWINPDSYLNWMFLDFLGLLIVYLFAVIIGKILEKYFNFKDKVLLIIGSTIWYIPLFIIQIIVYWIAISYGRPYGE